jgi:addiction module HigA family antidote
LIRSFADKDTEAIFRRVRTHRFQQFEKIALRKLIQRVRTMSRQQKTGRIPFPHPGETLREDYLKPLGMSVSKLAAELHVPATRLTEIIHRRRGVTADTALRLARYFNSTPRFWLNLQVAYDLAVASDARAREIERAVNPREAA